MSSRLEALLGAPVVLEELKRKPGRRRTFRAVGSERTAIVKVYASGRAAIVAARVAALAGGPREPRLPAILLVEPALHLVVLSEVPGVPLRMAVLDGDAEACGRAGAALGRWHSFWRARAPAELRPHSVERELELLRSRVEEAPSRLASEVRAFLPALGATWPCPTVVHRDLYEEQVLLGDEVGLIDLDDAALGPPELDVGNLLAHLELLARRRRRDLDPVQDAFLDGYLSCGAPLDPALLARCRTLTLLRLACLHGDEALVEVGRDGGRQAAKGRAGLAADTARPFGSSAR